MVYYHYQLPRTNGTFFGINKTQIVKTVETIIYDLVDSNLKIPDEKEINEVKGIHLWWVYPLSVEDHFLEVKIRDDVIFSVNANAYNKLKFYLVVHKKLGELYEIQPNHLSVVFLPEEIMNNFWNYNWKKHEKEFEEMILDREKRLNNLEDMNVIKRFNTPDSN